MKLINADKLINDIVHKYGRDQSDAILEIAEAPIVDAEPVIHGRWIEVDVGDCCYRCSECGFIRDAYLLDISNYCPKCGAKMDEV